jgi:hypothetical protein
MKRFCQMALVAVAAFVLALNVAMAVDSCSTWMKQADGSYWRTCVDDKGRQYCQVSVNNIITTVSCSTGKPIAVTGTSVAPPQNRGNVR